ncbi:MAG TPA: sigma-70 family RNA polymerase sigma factor [Acidimicrobiales bacterium]
MPEPDDLRRLADAAAHGDDVALAELVRATQPLVWRVCTHLGSAGEEEDLVQETYLRALRSLRSYRGEAPVRAWLAAVARHVCADHVRRRARRSRLLGRLLAATPAGTPSHNGPDGLTVDALLLDALDPDRREAFVLTQIAGLSYEEAAAAVGCPIGTIRSRVARARRELTTLIEQAEAR